MIVKRRLRCIEVDAVIDDLHALASSVDKNEKTVCPHNRQAAFALTP